MVSSKALKEFIEIWRTEIGTDISDAEATNIATSLLTLMDAIYKPIKKSEEPKD